MGYYNLPPTQYAAELNDFEKMLRTLPLDGADVALELLEKFTRNVVQNPAEPKFRRLRTTNDKLAPLFGLPGALDILFEMGWYQEAEFVILPEGVNLDFQAHVVKIIEAKQYYSKQREDAKRSAKIASDPKKGDLLKQLEIDRRERSAAAGQPIATSAPAPKAAPAAVSAPPPAPAAAGGVDENEVTRLMDVTGQPGEACRDALRASGGRPDAAVEVLLGLAPPPAPASGTLAPAKAKPTAPAAAKAKSAFDFQRPGDAMAQRKEAEASMQDLRALRKAQFDDAKGNPNAQKTPNAQKPPATGGAKEEGWFDWMWGGSSSSGGGGGGGGGGGRDKPKMKTIGDLPKPVRRGGG